MPLSKQAASFILLSLALVVAGLSLLPSEQRQADRSNAAYAASAPSVPTPPTLGGHSVVLDANGKLLSWLDQSTAYDQVMWLSWDFIKNKGNYSGI